MPSNFMWAPRTGIKASLRRCTILLIALALSPIALAQDEARALLQTVLGEHIETPTLVGQTTFKVAFWKIYNISLYTDSTNFNDEAPYALEIEYLRDFSGEAIAEKSVQLILDQGFEEGERLDLWQQQMTEVFPDIDKGTVLTGIHTRERTSVFYGDGKYLGVIEDPEFGQYFFGIWLAEDTSEPNMRTDLLGSESL